MDETDLKDSERLTALARTGVMDGPGPGAHQRAARIAARLLDVPVSLVTFVDDKRQHFSAHTGLDGAVKQQSGSPLSHSICKHVVATQEPLVIADATKDPRVARNGAVRDLGVVAYLGVPIRSPGGHVLGSFCAIDRKPRDWHADDVAHMHDIAEMIEADLRLRETLEERDIVLQEMSHRVKNLFTIVNSILRMERRAHDTAEALAESVGARLKALSDAHDMIVPVVNASRTTGPTTTLGAMARKILAPHAGQSDTRITIAGDDIPVGPKSAVYLTLALHELATNAAKYGGLSVDEGRLSIRWHLDEDDLVQITWEETGMAWDTKSLPHSGFGSRLLSIAVEGQLAGQIDTRVAPDRFSRCLSIPAQRLRT